MFNRAELKESAKSQLRGKWGSAVLFTFVYVVLVFVASALGYIPIFGYIISLLISAPLTVGLIIAYINFVKSNNALKIEDMFLGFNIYGKSLGIILWQSLWIFLWSLLFFIPGIIKAISYSQSVFIIADNPNVRVTDALKISMKMTKGYKMDIFIMGLSFIGWGLLCTLTFGIGSLWLTPYMLTSYTNLYYKLKQKSIESGVCREDEFNGTASPFLFK